MFNRIKEKIFEKYMKDEYQEYKHSRLYGGNAKKFRIAMSLLDFCKNDKERIDSIEVLTDMIINEIKYDFMNCYIYHNYDDIRKCKSFFPKCTWDEEGETIECRYAIKRKCLDLAKDRIISNPWDRRKAIRNIIKLRHKDFVFHENNHFGVYYSPFDICHIYNGNHSVMAGIANKKQGKILIEEIDISPLFPHVDTDGEYWLHKYNEAYKDPVWDYRLSIIYKLYKTKYELLD